MTVRVSKVAVREAIRSLRSRGVREVPVADVFGALVVGGACRSLDDRLRLWFSYNIARLDRGPPE
jgi:hypothetical protein